MATRSYLKFLVRRVTSQFLPHVDSYRYILYHADLEVRTKDGSIEPTFEVVLAEAGVVAPLMLKREYARETETPIVDMEITPKWYLSSKEAAQFDSAKMYTKTDEKRMGLSR